ncbi:ubiquinone/menaquinone biosynthesis methyltransferase [Desulfonatronum thiosulfatophilum]|nr:ubiquinone/menaquinone biosynthesis methyltransferase [Desulfonatronum thiosulfatophilum]
MHEKVSYGYERIPASEKRRRVLGHFETIAHRYDLADALLSFGLHFFWRRRALRRLNLRPGERVMDLCGGTGDFAVMASKAVGPSGRVTVCDFSRTMMDKGRCKAAQAGQDAAIQWVQGDAENMAFAEDSFDAVIVGYGIRNFVFLERGLGEIRRVLKPGGRFLAMEFSIPQSFWLRTLYHYYSFRIMPRAGRLITGTAEPFHYLAESIRVFPSPARVQDLLTENHFVHATHELMSNGLAVLYSGQKEIIRLEGTFEK